MAPLKLISVGNPGAGKSSFGNCLLGKAEFHAAASESGGGVTREKKEASSDKYRYVDIPGLADPDPKLREAAAKVVTEGLKEDVNTKMLFFVRTVQGRILSEDKVLMARVAEALGSNLQENKYGVIINQMKKKAYQAVTEDANKKREWLAKLWVGMTIHDRPMPRTDFVCFNPEDEDMDGEMDKVKPLPDHVLKFLDEFPAVVIKSAEVKLVDTKNFDAAVEEQVKVDKSNSWEDVAKNLVSHLGSRAIDLASDAAEIFVNPLSK